MKNIITMELLPHSTMIFLSVSLLLRNEMVKEKCSRDCNKSLFSFSFDICNFYDTSLEIRSKSEDIIHYFIPKF